MTNLNHTSATGMSSASGSEEVNQAIISLTQYFHTVMDKHMLMLERSEKTTITLVAQLLKAQEDITALNARLLEAEQLAPKLRETEEARDSAMARCSKAVDELNSFKAEVRDYLLKHHSLCHPSTQLPPISARPTPPPRDRSLASIVSAPPFRTSLDHKKDDEL